MKEIKIFTRYGNLGASSRYRLINYKPYLSEIGINFKFYYLLDDNYLKKLYSKKFKLHNIIKNYIKRVLELFKLKNDDIIIIEKELFPYLPYQIENFFLKNKKYILDYDDAVFHNYDISSKFIIKIFLKNKIKNLIRNSTGVIVGNKYLEDYAKAFNKNITLIPSLIDVSKYNKVQVLKSKVFTIVWIGSPSTIHYLSSVFNVLKKICIQYNFKLRIIGAKLEENLPFIEYITWSEAKEVDALKSAHLGIMPLIDEYWSRGKCGFKLIQYMAAKLPTIASEISANKQIVLNNQTGLFANNDREWEDAILEIYKNKNKFHEFGNNGYNRVNEFFSYQSKNKDFLNVISNLFFKKYKSEDQIINYFNTDKIEISIVCTTFMHGKFIQNAIDGFLMQNIKKRYEIIIHDDNSKDNTRQIINFYKNRYPRLIKVIYQNENQYSKGLRIYPIVFKYCKGEFIALCDGDDYWINSNKLSSQIEIMESNKKYNISFHNAIFKTGGRINIFQNLVFKNKQIDFISTNDVIKCGGELMPTSSIVIRRIIIDNLPDFIYSAPVTDMYLQIYSALNNGAIYINKKMSVYNTMTSNSWSRKMNIIKEREEWYNQTLESIDQVIDYVSPKYKNDLNYLRTSIIAKMSYFYLSKGKNFNFKELVNKLSKYKIKMSLESRIILLLKNFGFIINFSVFILKKLKSF